MGFDMELRKGANCTFYQATKTSTILTSILAANHAILVLPQVERAAELMVDLSSLAPCRHFFVRSVSVKLPGLALRTH
jgi:hypothetical protein